MCTQLHLIFYLYRNHEINLADLPDLILVNILQTITLEELLLIVSITCKRLHRIINSNSRLWRYVLFDWEINIDENTLANILSYSVGFWTFLLPYANIICPVPDLDLILIRGLSASKSLYWLDLSVSCLRCVS